MKTLSIIKHAEGLSKEMTNKKFDNGTERVIIKEDAKHHEELLNLTFKVKEETSLSTDSAYSFTLEVLDAIAGLPDDSDETALEDVGSYLEADVYTSDLTNWLNESTNHLTYMDEAIEEAGESMSAFDLLQQTQLKGKNDAFSVIYNHLVNTDWDQK